MVLSNTSARLPTLSAGIPVVEIVGTVVDESEQCRSTDALKKALDEIKALRDRLLKENIVLREEIDKASVSDEIIGESGALHAVLSSAISVAHTDSTVLITGETGTGKELIARAIHKRSGRSSRMFVNVNCAAIPQTLIASELFGHEKGAFTGATQRRLGRFELADGGTIFLDEVGELPMETQITLLRVLQEREFERVGGNQTIRVDVRVVAATNRDLHGAIESGAFRRDLYYRLNVVPLEVPALRDRREDIPALTQYFIRRFSKKLGKNMEAIEPRTVALLQDYSWPGNIRELQNLIERSVIISESSVLKVDPSRLSISAAPVRAASQPDRRASLAVRTENAERSQIESALARSRGRVSGPFGAAAELGIPASTLESKIRALKINKYRYREA